jgi:hypothetical protein
MARNIAQAGKEAGSGGCVAFMIDTASGLEQYIPWKIFPFYGNYEIIPRLEIKYIKNSNLDI